MTPMSLRRRRDESSSSTLINDAKTWVSRPTKDLPSATPGKQGYRHLKYPRASPRVPDPTKLRECRQQIDKIVCFKYLNRPFLTERPLMQHQPFPSMSGMFAAPVLSSTATVISVILMNRPGDFQTMRRQTCNKYARAPVLASARSIIVLLNRHEGA